MTVTARKHNPGFLTDDELVASFCVRTNEFRSMVEALRECTGNANTHQIVIGPRGSGKTSLLLRIATEIRRNEELSLRFFPVVFSEESYEVSTIGEFWLECLSRLADQVSYGEDNPDLHLTYDELRQIRDDRILGERCLGVLQDFADREDKRLVLIVENLNMLLGDIGHEDTGWQLRHALQTDPRIVLLASATSRFDEIDNPDKALYDLFRRLSLHPLDKDDCAILWQAVSGQSRAPETIQALRILTGGSPRLLTIVARFGANLSFHELMSDLLNLVDDHTEYFKSYLDGLPAQERKVYLALAQLWKPVTAREIADRARLDTNQCSAHLKRLTERGAVEVAGGTDRRKLYYVAERLYNIYYLMRRARGRTSLVEALICFMKAQYSPSELRSFFIRTVNEALSLDDETKWIYPAVFDRLLKSPSLSRHRKELSTLASRIHPLASSDAEELSKRALELAEINRFEEALEVWEEVIERIRDSDSPTDLHMITGALVGKAWALADLNQFDQALKVYDEVFGRPVDSDDSDLLSVAIAHKTMLLDAMGRKEEALTFRDEATQQLSESDEPRVVLAAVEALDHISESLVEQNRLEEALAVWDEKATLLAKINRFEEALAQANRLCEPESPTPEIRCQGRLMRAHAHFLQGDEATCMLDVESALSILSELDSLPREILNSLYWLAVELGPAQLRELIVASPASDMLFPLTTALERELGLEPRVAREVEEVAEDVQRDLEERRKSMGRQGRKTHTGTDDP